jgi:hypothetical protein
MFGEMFAKVPERPIGSRTGDDPELCVSPVRAVAALASRSRVLALQPNARESSGIAKVGCLVELSASISNHRWSPSNPKFCKTLKINKKC